MSKSKQLSIAAYTDEFLTNVILNLYEFDTHILDFGTLIRQIDNE